ncbi:tetratricopeptide repeat protein [Comamonas testosteroni]|uniref:tetratricopeptide repeat protein n=1 Tax=Comamonas testosteroni TaxID=285 RepID=UPI0038999583
MTSGQSEIRSRLAVTGRAQPIYRKNIKRNAEKKLHLYSAAALLLASTLAMAQPADLLHKAQAGDAQAQLDLGQIYVEGRGVAQSDERAAHWFGLAAAQGNALSQSNLGLMYDRGRGVKQSD